MLSNTAPCRAEEIRSTGAAGVFGLHRPPSPALLHQEEEKKDQINKLDLDHILHKVKHTSYIIYCSAIYPLANIEVQS